VEENRGNAARLTAPFPINLVPVTHVEQAGSIRFEGGIELALRFGHARGIAEWPAFAKPACEEPVPGFSVRTIGERRI
jgi:hypothetical protein